MPRNMPERVVIDGVEYVPVLSSSPEIRDISAALISLWYGKGSVNDLVLYMDKLRIDVNDNGDGMPMEEAIAKISVFLGKTR